MIPYTLEVYLEQERNKEKEMEEELVVLQSRFSPSASTSEIFPPYPSLSHSHCQLWRQAPITTTRKTLAQLKWYQWLGYITSSQSAPLLFPYLLFSRETFCQQSSNLVYA